MDRIIKARYIALFLLTAIMLSACTVISSNSGETNDVTIAQTDLETVHSTEAATSETSIAETIIEETESETEHYREIRYIEDEVKNSIPMEILEVLRDSHEIIFQGELVSSIYDLDGMYGCVDAVAYLTEYDGYPGYFYVADVNYDGLNEVLVQTASRSFWVYCQGDQVKVNRCGYIGPIYYGGYVSLQDGASRTFFAHFMGEDEEGWLITESNYCIEYINGALIPTYYIYRDSKKIEVTEEEFLDAFPAYANKDCYDAYSYCKENIY